MSCINLAVYNLYSTFNKYKFLLYIDEPASNCVGKIYAVIERENDVEDKLIVVTNNKEYSIEEIKCAFDSTDNLLINGEKLHFEVNINKYKFL